MSEKSRARLVIFCLVAALVLGVRDCMNPFNDSLFSSAKWKEAYGDERIPMAENLMESYLPEIHSHEELQSLLGEPESKWPAGYKSRHLEDAVEEWIFHLGASGLSAPGDDSKLVISLDSDGAVLGSFIKGV